MALAGWLLTLAGVAVALDRERTIGQLHHTAWTARAGGPSQVWALAQTADGFLWIGTATGLFRFDGVQFERYQPPDGTSLPTQHVLALLAVPDGSLWISFRNGTLGLLANGSLHLSKGSADAPPGIVYSFARDIDGRIWAGTSAGLALRDGERWQTAGAQWNFPERELARVLGVDRDGTVWASTSASLHFLPRGASTFTKSAEQVNLPTVIAQGPDGRHWLAEPARSVRPLATDAQPGSAEEEIVLGSQAVQFDRSGSLWIGTLGDGVRRLRSPVHEQGADRLESFTEGEGLSADYVTAVLEDREGNLWFGSGKGIDRFRGSAVVPVALPAGHQHFTLMAGSDGDVWAGSASPKPVLRIRGDEHLPQPGVGPVLTAMRNADGTVWWGGYEGLWRQQGDAFSHVRLPDGVKPGNWLMRSLHAADGGGLWVNVASHGFVRLHDGVWDQTPPAGYPDGSPTAVFTDAGGAVWLAVADERVYRIAGGRMRTYAAGDGLAPGRISVIHGRGPHLWFAGDRGLTLYRDDRFHPVRTAGDEPFGGVSGLIETAAGDVWMNESQGIVRIPAGEVAQLLADPRHPAGYRRFDYLDGLPGAPQMIRPPLTVAEASDGRLWFATDNGLARIDPDRIDGNPVPPPVIIRELHVDGQRLAPDAMRRLPVGAGQLRIVYTATGLSMPERVRFRYRLEGVDRGWQEAGTRREAAYTNLAPGEYRFEVTAANEDGVWNEAGAGIGFVIPPAFFQTAWFIFLCVGGLIGLLWLAYLRHLQVVSARLRDRLEERHLERERIARELHDTLLQGFQGVILRFQAAADRIPPHEPAREAIERALERADDVLVEGRDRVRGLRASFAADRDLGRAFAQVGEELAHAGAATFRVVVEGEPAALDPVVRDEIYQLGREAIINAFHHAGATAIEVEIVHGGSEFTLRIRDDGRGIDPAVLSAGERPGHWGLAGMRERAARIGARLDIWCRPGAGTEVELRMPAAQARIGHSGATWRSWLRRSARKETHA